MMIPFFPVFSIVLAAWTVWRKRRRIKHRSPNGRREFVLWVFFFYMAAVVKVTFFPIFIGSANGHNNINLIPVIETLKLFAETDLNNALMNVAGNIVMFLPFGLLLPILYTNAKSIRKMAQCGFVLSLCIETLQLTTRVRIFDVDDLIFNTIGSVLGYGCYLGIIRRKHKLPAIAKMIETESVNPVSSPF